MKIRNTLALGILFFGLSACDKKEDSKQACIAACEHAQSYNDRCGVEQANCETECDQDIEAGCEDDAISFFNCAAEVDWSGVECSEEAALVHVAVACVTDFMSYTECAGLNEDTGY